jgi:hypothetical protein
MTRHDLGQFTAELTVLAEVYSKSVSEAMGAVYFEALKDYALSDVIRGLRCHLKHPEQGRWFPKPADVIALIDGDTNSQALEAYQVLDDALIQHGVYRSVRFADAALAATVKALGGWVEIEARWKDREQEPYLRADFCKLYRVYTARGLDVASVPDHFPGLHELSNGTKYPDHVPQPILVGTRASRAITRGAQKELTP